MADKTTFTKEEWTLLLESPMIAGMAVTAVNPSGLWGLLEESFRWRNCLNQSDSRRRHRRSGKGRSHRFF